MLRVRSITPIHVDAAELDRRQRRYNRLAPPGVAVHLDDLGSTAGVPRALDTSADVRRSEELVVAEILRTDPDSYDVVLPDCVLDPGVGELDDAPVTLFGLLRLSSSLLAGAGVSFAAVTRNGAIGAELSRKIGSYGLTQNFAGVRVLGLAVADIADDDSWAEAISRSVTDLEVAEVVNGCSAVEVHPARTGPGIVDPTATALRMLPLASQLGLISSAGRP